MITSQPANFLVRLWIIKYRLSICISYFYLEAQFSSTHLKILVDYFLNDKCCKVKNF